MGSSTTMKEFADFLEKTIREVASVQLLESEITYISVDRNDEFDITITAGYKGIIATVLQLEFGRLPASMPMWSAESIWRRISAELATVVEAFRKGDSTLFTGAFSFIYCIPAERED